MFACAEVCVTKPNTKREFVAKRSESEGEGVQKPETKPMNDELVPTDAVLASWNPQSGMDGGRPDLESRTTISRAGISILDLQHGVLLTAW